MGPEAIVGVSAHSVVEAKLAADEGANYLTASPVFMTNSKPGYGPALGPEGLAQIVASVRIPVLALGGVTVENAASCMSAGAAGVAVMGSVMQAQNPGTVVAELIATLTVTHD